MDLAILQKKGRDEGIHLPESLARRSHTNVQLARLRATSQHRKPECLERHMEKSIHVAIIPQHLPQIRCNGS